MRLPMIEPPLNFPKKKSNMPMNAPHNAMTSFRCGLCLYIKNIYNATQMGEQYCKTIALAAVVNRFAITNVIMV